MYEVTLRKTRSYAPVTAEVTLDVYEQIEKLIASPKSLAQQIREQLEREGMTVKQILADNYDHGASHLRPKNMLTECEARRREVEHAILLVQKELPSESKQYLYLSARGGGYLVITSDQFPTIGCPYMNSEAQWHLLRDVIGDEGLKELIQK